MPKPKIKPDRRIARTQHSLHRALNTLILEKGYRATTVADIVNRADVGRSTFYAHHGSKEGLLLNGLHHLHDALARSETQRAESLKPVLLGFSQTFFEHVHEYRDVFQAVREDECGPAVTRKIIRVLTEMARHDLEKAKAENRSDRIPRDAVVQFVTETLFSILLWWLERRPELSPIETNRIFRELALPALAANGIV